MKDITSGEELYLWGMFKNIWKKKDEKILVCSRCGSKNIAKVTILEPVCVDLTVPYKCKDCG